MGLISLLSAVIIVAMAAFHHYSLLGLRRASSRLLPPHGARPVAVFVGLVVVHAVEIAVWAAVWAWANDWTGPVIDGQGFQGTPLDWLYLSGVMFATLGYAPFDVVGDARLLAIVESLLGFMLLTWSATYLYSVCQNVWNDAD
ncbi:ion channel [Maricaulis sp. CAU 1757]